MRAVLVVDSADIATVAVRTNIPKHHGEEERKGDNCDDACIQNCN